MSTRPSRDCYFRGLYSWRLEVEVEPSCDRLDLHVVVHDVHRDRQCGCAVVVLAAQVDEAILHTEADVACHFVLQPGTDGPSVPPVVERKAVGQRGIPSRYVDLRAGPPSFGVDEPLVGRKAQTTGHRGDRVDVGAVGHSRRLDTAKVTTQRGVAQRRFRAEYDVAELLIVADLSATNEPAGIVVDALARQ